MRATAKSTSPNGPFIRGARVDWSLVEERDRFPFFLPVVTDLEKIPFHPRVTFLVGENGSGKSTLIEAIAVACGLNAEGGSRNFNFATRRSHSELSEYLTVLREPVRPRDSFFLRAESFYNVASEIERLDEGEGGAPIINAYGGKPLHGQSHGEAFLSLFMHRFMGHGLYFLDEPEAALSPSRQLTFLLRLHELVKMGSQFVIATHSPLIMAYPDAYIAQLGATGIAKTSFIETEHYSLTKLILENPSRFMERLLNPPEI